MGTERGVGVVNAGAMAAQAGDLTLTASGQLVQSGQMTASGNTSISTAGGVDNSGTVYAQNAASISTGGALTNSGTVAAQQDTTLNAASIASTGVLGAGINSDGTVGTHGTLSVVSAGALDNSGGTLIAPALTIQSGDLANRGGTLSAQSSAVLGVAALDNSAGGRISAQNLAIADTGALDNAGGSVEANGTLNVSAQAISNDGGTLANGGTGTTTVAASGTLTNTNGGLIGGNGDVSVSAQGTLTNTGGLLYGGTALNLGMTQPGATLVNDGGQIESVQDISMAVASMSNAGGAVSANRDIAFSGALSGAGAMTAGHDLTLALQGDFTNAAAGTLHADNDLTLGVTGALTNAAQLEAGHALTVNAANVVNAAGAAMNSAATTVNATGGIANAGAIEGDAVATHSTSLDNTGAVIGNNVSATAADISNAGAQAVIAGAASVGVYASHSLTNSDGALLYSGGDMELARDSARDSTGLLANQTGTITNRAATIEAAGNLDVAAHTLNNERTGVQTQAGAPVTTAGPTLTLWTAGLPLVGGDVGYFSDLYPQWSFNTAIGTSVIQQLATPVTVTLSASQVTNLNTANQTFSLAAPLQDQTTYVASQEAAPQIITRTITNNPTQYYRSLAQNPDGTVTITFWPDYDPSKNIAPDQVQLRYDLGPDSHDYVETSRTAAITTTTDQLLNAGTPALMQAQGAIRVNADGGAINNASSTMAAGGDLIRRATGGTVNDTGILLQQTSTETDTSTFYWHAKTSGDTDTQTVVDGTVPLSTATVAALPAIATSNQTVRTDAQNITIGSVNPVGQTVTGAGEPGGSVAQTLGGAGVAIPGLVLPTNALYTYHPAPGSGPLIETDPRFTSYSNFVSSDYMLQQLGLNPQNVEKRLGDGLYEEQLVMGQVTQLTGRTFLGSYTDNLDEYTALMNSGVQYAQQFGLAVGVGLTAEQMSALTTNMVWLVNQTVMLPDGTQQTVLVPQLYLAQSNAVDLQASGALVAGATSA